MRSALGKGLEALISEETAANVASTIEPQAALELPIERITANPKQPRQHYNEQALAELADSIRQQGVLQPILVSRISDGHYEIIAGERRWRAAQRAGLKQIPAVVRSVSDVERFQMALIENLQREDLNPLEQARGFLRLADEFHMTQEQIAAVIGKDRTVVSNLLRLLNLPEAIQNALSDGKISSSHARAIAALENAEAQQALFQRIVDEGLSVRAVEQAARELKQVPVKSHLRSAVGRVKSPEERAIEEDLQRVLARKVELQTAGPAAKKGWLRLEFYSLEDFDHLIAQLKRVSHTS